MTPALRWRRDKRIWGEGVVVRKWTRHRVSQGIPRRCQGQQEQTKQTTSWTWMRYHSCIPYIIIRCQRYELRKRYCELVGRSFTLYQQINIWVHTQTAAGRCNPHSDAKIVPLTKLETNMRKDCQARMTVTTRTGNVRLICHECRSLGLWLYACS